MSKYCRVFIKGEPLRWFDFPYQQGETFVSFFMKSRFEGMFMGEIGAVPYDSMLCACEIQRPGGPQLWMAPAQGNA
jgi:hypothetical protein